MPKFCVILPAAGKSTRFQDREKKPFANLDGRAVWLRSAELFVTRSDVSQCLIVVAPEDEELFRRRYTANLAFMNVKIVPGGRERVDSVANALERVSDDCDYVAIHDAVRPCLLPEQINAVFAAAVATGAAILAVPIADSVKRATANGRIECTVPRERLWLAQTPQVFRKDWLLAAYGQRNRLPQPITDDAQLVEAAGHPVQIVEGHPTNIKITTKADLQLAEAILKSRPKPKGQGPIHPFAEEAQW
jgi:2-C-methyl-D-erythritol 4-phosphate cytidylyltransferase